MAAWHLIVRTLYERGPLSTYMLSTYVDGDVGSACNQAVVLGLLVPSARGGDNRGRKWQLTQRGVDLCEGRVDQVETRPGGRRWVSTWLSALPRDITLKGAS